MSAPSIRPRGIVRRRALLGCATALLGLTGASPAWANTYYAGSASTVTTGNCGFANSPCRLDYALTRPGNGDEVVVEPGTYSITTPLSANGAFTLTGEHGQPRPALIGASTLSDDILDISGGATVSDLYIQANAPRASALSFEGGHADNLSLDASSSDAQGEALSIKNTATGTLVTDTVAHSEAPNGEAISFKDSKTTPGSATAVNVTAIANGGGGEAISANMVSGSASVKDSIALALGGEDVSAKPGTHNIDVSYSDFDPSYSGGYNDAGNNNTGAPSFCDAAAGQYEEASGSPTIGAGKLDTSDSALTDPDGTARSSDGSVDMGAYQYVANCPSSARNGSSSNPSDGAGPLGPAGLLGQGGAGEDVNPPIAVAPVLGQSVFVAPAKGTVLVRRPGAHRFSILRAPATVPVESVIDARRGGVTLVTAIVRGDGRQTGSFFGGTFRVSQSTSERGMTDLILLGGDFRGCTTRSAAVGLASIARTSSRRSSRHVVRQLWGGDNGGQFSTWGRSSVATVRGTVWLTQDRCDGTLTRVLRGRVLVHSLRHNRNVLVSAGHAYLAPS